MMLIGTSASVVAQTTHRNHGASLSLAIGHRNADSTRNKAVDLGIVGAADTLRGASVQAVTSGYGETQPEARCRKKR